MPDALSKTVPIWCCVLNRTIVRLRERERKQSTEQEGTQVGTSHLNSDTLSGDGWDTELHLPPYLISPSERDQIEQRIDGWVDDLLGSSYTLPVLSKPLRPVWIVQPPEFLSSSTDGQVGSSEHPGLSYVPQDTKTLPYHPIVCLTASIPFTTLGMDLERRTRGGNTYIQGAGDDHESWSMVCNSMCILKIR